MRNLKTNQKMSLMNVDEIVAKQDFMIRDSLNESLVQQYAENIEYILVCSPLEIWDTPDGNYLADGFHRLAAARFKGMKSVNVRVSKGSVQDAYAAACLANLFHGKPLTRSEREKARKEFIKIHPEWSNVKLATEVSCSDETIRRYRGDLEASGEIESQKKRIGKDNREISTEAIGTSTNVEVESIIDPFDPWFEQHVLQGDALEIMPTLNKQYDLAIIDPPYGITTEKWDLKNKHELLAFTRQWLRQILPLMKPSGRLFIFWSREYMFELKPVLDEIAVRYPLLFGGMLVWHFRNVGSMPDNTKRYKLSWEPIFYYYGKDAQPLNFTRTEVSGEKWKGEEQWDVWTYAIPQSNFGDKRVHPTQKPLELYKHIIESASHTGDNILDCFAGSGTTGHAATLTGRDFTLIEQDKEYVELIKNRLKSVWLEGQQKNDESN
uniref:Putative methyltransferase n=2 Tax=viral metagenome TaxID=1070528 RepID=A0A6M3M6R8_9ZZZZ